MSPRLTVIITATFLVGSSLVPPASGTLKQDIRRVSWNSRPGKSKIDLARIGHIFPKGRVQDRGYNSIEVVDQLIAMGSSCIPYLISKLEDERKVRGDVVDYWAKVTVGDIAFIILTDFFLDASWEKSTIPGLKWDEFLEVKPAPVLTGEQQLRRYIARHGRNAIKAKWQRVWFRHKRSLYWDDGERCFKVRKS